MHQTARDQDCRKEETALIRIERYTIGGGTTPTDWDGSGQPTKWDRVPPDKYCYLVNDTDRYYGVAVHEFDTREAREQYIEEHYADKS